MLRLKPYTWWLLLSTLTCLALAPAARSGVIEAIAQPTAGYLMFPMVFVAAPVSVTPGVPGP